MNIIIIFRAAAMPLKYNDWRWTCNCSDAKNLYYYNSDRKDVCICQDSAGMSAFRPRNLRSLEIFRTFDGGWDLKLVTSNKITVWNNGKEEYP
jgi:hypothetical protein